MKNWIEIDHLFKNFSKVLIDKKMFTTKKVNVYFDLKDVKEYISRITPSNADTELHEIIEAVKKQNADLEEVALKALKKKHKKKIQKSYLHAPTNNAMDEIAKNNLQEFIYQLGIEEVNQIIQMAQAERK